MEGIMRIKQMAEGQKDYVLLEIVKYLISRTDMNEKYSNEEKTLKGMAEYIQGEIIKDFCKKMKTDNPQKFAQNIKYGEKSINCLAVGMSEKRTFELAIQYFDKSNKELGIHKKEKEVIKKEKDIFGSIFEDLPKEEEKKEAIEQISLFQM